jgi:hypothetical protein
LARAVSVSTSGQRIRASACVWGVGSAVPSGSRASTNYDDLYEAGVQRDLLCGLGSVTGKDAVALDVACREKPLGRAGMVTADIQAHASP